MTTREIVDQLNVAHDSFFRRADKVEELLEVATELLSNRGVVIGVQNAVESLSRANRWAFGVGKDIASEREGFAMTAAIANRLLLDGLNYQPPQYGPTLDDLRGWQPDSGEQILGLNVRYGGVSVKEEIGLLVTDLESANPRAAERLGSSINNALTLTVGMMRIHRGTFDVALALREGRAPSFNFLRGSR